MPKKQTTEGKIARIKKVYLLISAPPVFLGENTPTRYLAKISINNLTICYQETRTYKPYFASVAAYSSNIISTVNEIIYIQNLSIIIARK
jgi:hypothetical protein